MLEWKGKCIIGLDLAGVNRNPTGYAQIRENAVKTCLLYTDNEIIQRITESNPVLVAIDAPLSLPKEGALRVAERKMLESGYRVFPPTFCAMRKLTLRAIELNKHVEERRYKTIEVHPTSTRKALQMPLKEWETIQETLKIIGLRGELERRTLITHEIDAVTAALTALLYLQKQTETIGDENGCIVVPKKRDWRTLIT